MSKPTKHKGVCAEERIRAVHLAAQAAGTTCLETQWLGSDGRHRFHCKQGHEWTQRGYLCARRPHCPKCGHRPSLYKRENFVLLHEAARARGGECLSGEYLGLAARYRFRCRHGHEWTAEGKTVLRKGTWCRACWRASCGVAKPPKPEQPYPGSARAPAARLTQQEWLDRCKDSVLERMKALAQARGGCCLSEQYTGAGRYRFRCAQGHEWMTSSKRLFDGGWCRLCKREAGCKEVPAERSPCSDLPKARMCPSPQPMPCSPSPSPC